MSIKNVFTKSIGAKLIALFLIVSIVPIIVVGVLSYNNAQNALEKSIAETLISTAITKANHIANFRTVTLDIIQIASHLDIFQDNLNNVDKGIEVKQSTDFLKGAMNDFCKNSNTFYRAKIMDKNGIVVASTTGIINQDGKDLSDKVYFREGLKASYVSDPYKSIELEENIEQIAYSTPVHAEDSNVPIGVIVIHQALDNEINKGANADAGLGINGIVLSREIASKTGETYLVNKDRLMLTPSRFEKDVFLKKKVNAIIFDNKDSDSALLEPYKNYKGVLVVGDAEPVEGTDWVIIEEHDIGEAFALIYKLRNQILVTGIIIAVVVVFLALFVSRYFTTPVIKLTTIAKSISIGDLSQDLEIKFQDEIGELANSFKDVQHNMKEKTIQANRISQGDLTIEVKPLSDKDKMGIAFKAMVASLNEKAGLAEEIANGNLTIEVKPLSDKDKLGNALKTMVDKNRFQISEISEGINVLASSTSEIMASVSQLASGTAETASLVGETTTTVEEVKQTAELSNQKAKHISESGKKTMEISQSGTKAIEDTIEGMNRIKQQMESIANIVISLSEQGQTIGEIVTLVNDLSEQSNLLAVNAAIEAAKAGEQGKGFAVVAQEIRNLAERSKEATAQVRTILTDIQKSTSSAVMATEEGGKTVEEGIELSTTTGKVIKALSDSVTEASHAAIQIASSSQQQLVGMDQVASAMESIKEATVQNAASTKQSETFVTELHKLGEKLQELIKQYKVKS